MRTRRTFLRDSLLTAGTLLLGRAAPAAALPADLPANKRERLHAWLEGRIDYVLAAFFMHFADDAKVGLGAARRHAEFFRATEMDFVKIQYEQHYTPLDWLRTPADWAKLEVRPLDFYEPVLIAVRELVQTLKSEAMIVMTLYSPFMWAGHVATLPRLLEHMHQDPEAVMKGLAALTESQLLFARECIRLGVDGFYMSTQGSESRQLRDPGLFLRYVKPTDLVAMNEAMARCSFNILHVCDYNAPYTSYDAVADYPGHVVNCSHQLVDRELTWPQLEATFRRPMFGGLPKAGVISRGSPADIEAATRALLAGAPARFMAGAECTVPGTTPWENLRAACRAAHAYRRG
jgi:uroporphyrinogen decarboxylase